MGKETEAVVLEPAPKAAPTTPAPAPAPDPAEIDRLARQRAKELYGIEDDDPEVYKGRRQKDREAAELAPKLQAALYQIVQQAQRQAPPEPAPRQAELNEAELRDLARLDPWEAIRRVREHDQRQFKAALEAQQQTTAQMVQRQTAGSQAAAEASQRLREDWPEAYDTKSDLYQTGLQIYWREMTDWERALPTSFVAATERAAARIGLPPRSKRAQTNPSPSHREVDAQNVGGGGKKAAKEDDSAELTAKERRIAEAMGNDPKIVAKAKAARAAKQNLVVSG